METKASPITDARLQGAYDYWCRIAAGRPMPRRADLDPIDIPKLLPHVMLVEVHGPGRYRYRLIGTANAQEHGMNATGQFLDEVLKGPEYKVHVLRLYDESVRERRAVYSESLFLSATGGAIERHTKVLFMPLSEDGDTVSQVFVAQIFHYVDQKTRDQHMIVGRPHKEIAHVLL
jgi:hypothetical protein